MKLPRTTKKLINAYHEKKYLYIVEISNNPNQNNEKPSHLCAFNKNKIFVLIYL